MAHQVTVRTIVNRVYLTIRGGVSAGGSAAIWGSITGTLSAQTDLSNALAAKASVTSLNTHIADTANPHAVTKTQVGLGNVDNTSDVNKPVSTAQQTALDLKINLTEKAANNGVATLDAGGKIPASQLPNTIMEFQGTWNATTNSPTLADGTGNAGDVYVTTVAGTRNLGSGAQTFAVGDYVVYNGSIWQKSINSNAVASVNGQQGVVVLSTADITENTNLYYTDERVDDRVYSLIQNGTGITWTYDDSLNTLTGNLNAAQSFTSITITGSGAASTPVTSITGTVFTGGTGTTTVPLTYYNSGNAPSTWSTSGTFIGINANSGFSGRFLDFHINGGVSVFSITNTGGVNASGTSTMAAIASTSRIVTSYAGAASVEVIGTTGALLTGQTGTTNFPQFFQQPSTATAVTTWSTSGTFHGINSVSGFVGNFLDFHVNGGASLFSINSAGNITTAGIIELGHASDTTIARVSAGVISVEGVTIPTISSINTLTNKFITPQLQSVADAGGTLTPVSITNDMVIATALSQATTIAAPTGSPVQGEKLIIRLKDNGTARALTWNAIYRAGTDVALPTTTVLSKTMYCGFIYNSTDTKWDLVAVTNNI